MYAEAVVFDAPPWLFQIDEDFSTSLSTLSIPQLQHVTQKLRIFCLHRIVGKLILYEQL